MGLNEVGTQDVWN